jgi:vesicle coat complex subunit
MLDKVIKENSNIKELIYCIGDYNSKNWGYIDHQSNACESENIEMFENEETLKDFIFGRSSYIHTDNDNH